MKVAQHEVVGNDAKRDFRPGSPESLRGKGRWKSLALSHAAHQRKPPRSSHPGRVAY